MQVDEFFQISKQVRYVALYLDGQLTLRERPALAYSSKAGACYRKISGPSVMGELEDDRQCRGRALVHASASSSGDARPALAFHYSGPGFCAGFPARRVVAV